MTVSIPYEIVDKLMLEEGAVVDVVVREDRVVMEPITWTWDAMCERLRGQAETAPLAEVLGEPSA